MNENYLRNKLRELGTKRVSRCESLACTDSDIPLEEGTTILMKKIRGPYVFGGPLFERSRTEGQLIKILQSLGLARSDSEGREAVHLIADTELPYSHDRYGDSMFRLDLDSKSGKYSSKLKTVDHAHKDCQRMHANYWD